MLIIDRSNCRLPQTPRTPSTAAAHYFDDIFTRQRNVGLGQRNHLRRSSTSRSIGGRSDWGESIEGDTNDETPFGKSGRSNSIFMDEALIKEKAEVDEQVASYVHDQLEMLKRPEATDRYGDELSAQLDDKAHINGHA